MGLLELFKTEGKKFLKDAFPGGLLNPEITKQSVLDTAAIASTPVPVAGDVMGLLADVNRYKEDPSSRTAGNFALSGLGLLPFVPAMTVWHGSPHKFDKFDMSKIGTGEGAQAYGHGIYTAESPEIAKWYRDKLAPVAKYDDTTIATLQKQFDDASKAYDNWIKNNAKAFADMPLSKTWEIPEAQQVEKARAALQDAQSWKKRAELSNLYKVDIPDEAVARFLDWDKKLSEQAPEVQKMFPSLERAKAINAEVDALSQKVLDTNDFSGEIFKQWDAAMKSPEYRMANIVLNANNPKMYGKGQMGSDIYHALSGKGQSGASNTLQDIGIPGIRYLDGGSRSAGQGSSNFVLFDDQLPRILETNGVPTGLQPWQPGEWQGLLR